MSMPIRHPMTGERIASLRDPGSNAAVAEHARAAPGLATAVLAWAKQVFAGPWKRAAPERERRSLFYAWAASDLAHRDVAGQMWPNSAPR